MMFTEEEAKTKACIGAPAIGFAILAAQTWSDGGEVTLAPGRTEGGLCIASQCMAWRWTTEPLNTRDRQETGRGYCGLAGKAQP